MTLWSRRSGQGFASWMHRTNALVAFLRIDDGLLRTAARTSAQLAPLPTRRSLAAWIKELPAPEKDGILLRALTDAPSATAELRERFSAEHRTQPRDTARRSRRRTVRDLVSTRQRA